MAMLDQTEWSSAEAANRAELLAYLGTGACLESYRAANIAWVIDGTFESPELASPEPGVHGRWTRDASGALVVKRRDHVWFTLVLPTRVELTSEPVPVVIFQHGLGGQRGNLFAVADTLCAAGFAVAGVATTVFTSSAATGPRVISSSSNTCMLLAVRRLIPSRTPGVLNGLFADAHDWRTTHWPRSTGVPSARFTENAVSRPAGRVLFVETKNDSSSTKR